MTTPAHIDNPLDTCVGTALDTEQRLRPYVPEMLLAWPPEVAWRELDGTLVSADISGFTALSERLAVKGREGAEELSALICDCFDGMIEEAFGRGGDILKFGGDALLVWFEGDQHATRAASAAIAMRRTIRNERHTSDGRKVALAISIGLNSGIHQFIQIVGAVPDLMITGPGATATVNAESDADAGMILVTPPTAALLQPSWLGDAHLSGVVLKRRVADPAAHAPAASSGGRPPSAFVPPVHRDEVLAGITNEHRQVAVSFLAFGGADRLVADGAVGELAGRLQSVTDAITAACARNGTHVLATDIAPDGGKFVIAGGAPRSIGNNEDRLLRTIREVVDTDPGLQLHAGVHRGSLFAGDLGSDRRRVYTTLGDSMNLSARLAGRAAPGQIVVSRVALDWSSMEFDVEPLAPFHVKGKGQPIHAGLLGAFVGRRPEQFDVDSPIVGRRGELGRLRALIDAAADGTSRGAVIVGEPGVGKTRILAELSLHTANVDPAPVNTVLMRCAPLDRLHGHSAIADLVRTLLEVPLDQSAEDVLDRLRALGELEYPESVALLPLLGPVFDVDLDDTPESSLVPIDRRATRTAQLLVQIVIALVHEHTVLLVDDVQYADEATAATIDLLCGAGINVALCTIVVGSRDRTPDGVVVVEVGPLPPADASDLVDALVGDAELSGATVRDILVRSDGNPMFATELVNAVLDGATGVPDSLDAAVEIRLDQLDSADRRVLCTAAVIGDEIDVVTLAALLDDGILSDDERWDRLDEFLERVGAGVVRFRFDTHRRVAYEALPFRTRRVLHRTLLERLEAEPGEPGRERLATMARHAAGSGDEAPTWRHSKAAAETAAELGLFKEAAELYRLAWGARRAAIPDELATVAERAGDALEATGDFEHASDLLTRAQTLAVLPIDRARLLRKRGDIAERRGDYPRAHRLYRRAAHELKSINWASALSEQAQLDCARSGLAHRQAHFDDAWRYGNLALSQAERVGDWATAAHAALLVDNLITQMTWSGVHVSRPDVLGLHQRAGDLVGAARWLSNQAVDRYYEGAWDEAVSMYRESAEQCARFGHLVSEATALNNIAEIDSDRGRYDEARQLFRSARRSWRAIGFGVGIAVAQSNLGRLATRTGDYAEAERLLTDAIERFDPLGMGSMAADARLRRIENALLAGTAVSNDWWPADADLEEDVVVEIYRDRLKVAVAALNGDAGAVGLASATVERARGAGVPFDLVLALRVRRAITGDSADEAEIASLHGQLGILEPPPIVPSDSRYLGASTNSSGLTQRR